MPGTGEQACCGLLPAAQARRLCPVFALHLMWVAPLTRPVLISLIGLAAAVLAIVLALTLGREEDAKTVDTPSAITVPAVSGDVSSSDPSFDVVRIGEHGDAVLAGRAVPKAEVVILDGTKEIGRTIADNRGEWVFVPNTPMPAGARQLRLRATNPDGTVVESGAPVVLVVPDRPSDQVLAFKALPGGGAKLLIGPPLGQGGISIDIIDADDKGKLSIGGRGPTGGKVHAYIDNDFAGAATIDADGAWRVQAKAPAAAKATIRADLVDDKGKVLARVELPYANAGDLHATGDAIVVTQGSSLWRIARKLYGSGEAYTVIYKANQEHIRNPDLIYPGQVFQIPKH